MFGTYLAIHMFINLFFYEVAHLFTQQLNANNQFSTMLLETEDKEMDKTSLSCLERALSVEDRQVNLLQMEYYAG